MFVKDIMSRKVMALSPQVPIADVNALMQQRGIRHFPIMASAAGEDAPVGERERLVGIVSDRDIRVVGSEHPDARPGVTLKSPVSEIMTRDVLTAHPLDPIEESARILREHRIGAMPVLEGDELVGIVTGIDFLEALVAITGVSRSSGRLEALLENRPGSLAELLASIAALGHNVSSVFTAERHEDSIAVVMRVENANSHELALDLRALGYAITWPASG